MPMELLLGIIGFFGVTALAVNGFFLRGILGDLNDVKIQIAVLIAGANDDNKTIERLERRLNEHETQLLNCRDRLHSLEGSSANMFSYIKEKDL